MIITLIIIVFSAIIVFAITKPQSAIILYILAIPFNHLLYRIILVSINQDIANIATAWKEVLLVSILLGSLRYVRSFRLSVADLIVTLFVCFQAVYLLAEPINRSSIVGFLYNTRWMLIYLIIRLLARDLQITSKILNTIILFNTFLAVTGLIQWLFIPSPNILIPLGWSGSELGDAYGGAFPRALSLLLAANEFGQTSVILLFSIILQYPQSIWNKSLPRYLMIIITLAAIAASLSRSSWLGMFLGLAILSLQSRRAFKITAFLVTLVTLLIIIGSISSSMTNIPFVQRVLAAFDPRDASTQARLVVLEKQFDLIADNPLGIGLATSSRAALNTSRSDILYSESYYLQQAIETGWIGLLLYITVFLVLAFQLLLVYQFANGSDRKLVLWAIASLVHLHTAGLIFPALGYFTPPCQMAALVAISFNRYQLARSQSDNPATQHVSNKPSILQRL